MASYQARQRDPIVDPTTQAMLERRGRELLGVALTGAALAFTVMLWTYSPDDPGWMVETTEPARNLLGRGHKEVQDFPDYQVQVNTYDVGTTVSASLSMSL